MGNRTGRGLHRDRPLDAAQWFPRPGESYLSDSISREAAHVRAAVGVCDISTLGKRAIQGPDAGAFLDRVYINTFSTLPVVRGWRVMLREDGFVMDLIRLSSSGG